MSFTLFISAAEDSAHLYAEQLLDYLLIKEPGLKTFGLGSVEMEKKGFCSVFPAKRFSIMGITDIFKQYFFLKKAFAKLVKEIELQKPKVVLLIDYPGFNLRLAKACKKRNIPVVYFIPPKIWASRKNRIKDLKATCDKILSIFEFEKPFYKHFKEKFVYVGNPLVNTIPKNYLDKDTNQAIRQKYGFSSNAKVVGLLPGSRKSEIQYILPTQIQVVEQLYKKDPKLEFSIFLAPSIEKESVQEYLKNTSAPVSIVKAPSATVLRIPDFILCASGTATLYAALFLKPCVVMYKVHSLTMFIAQLILNKKLKFFSLPNLILNKPVFPEFIQKKMKTKEIVQYVENYLHSTALQKQTKEDLKHLKEILKEKQPIEEVGNILLNYK
ncbi:MAG: lipid-A-disaccharide synthase [Bdellovibrionaceae bacterium]|nr:lipid-A-disaccharide synthase [Pseudobdellovibrionaceae bacterium]